MNDNRELLIPPSTTSVVLVMQDCPDRAGKDRGDGHRPEEPALVQYQVYVTTKGLGIDRIDADAGLNDLANAVASPEEPLI